MNHAAHTEIEAGTDRRATVEAGGTVTAHTTRDKALIAWAIARGAYVRIDRRSAWGNPFRIGDDGDRAEVIACFGSHVRSRPDLIARLGELRGKVLGCWCHPEPCHGDALIELLEG